MARQKNLVRRHEILRNTFILLKKRGMENVSLQMIADKSGFLNHCSNLTTHIKIC